MGGGSFLESSISEEVQGDGGWGGGREEGRTTPCCGVLVEGLLCFLGGVGGFGGHRHCCGCIVRCGCWSRSVDEVCAVLVLSSHLVTPPMVFSDQWRYYRRACDCERVDVICIPYKSSAVPCGELMEMWHLETPSNFLVSLTLSIGSHSSTPLDLDLVI